MLPGWYGTGTAFEAVDRRPTVVLRCCRTCTSKWPFFRTVLSNMAQVLAKSDMGLAARYAELVDDEELRHRVFGKIVDEHERTIRMHKLITGQDDLLADNPALACSVFNRFPRAAQPPGSNCCGGTAPETPTSWCSAASC